MLIDYISDFGNALEHCNTLGNRTIELFFKSGVKILEHSQYPNFYSSDAYRGYFTPVKACVYLCKVLKLRVTGPTSITDDFYRAAERLEYSPEIMEFRRFDSDLNLVRSCINSWKTEISTFCSSFDEQEKKRMNEAIHNHLEGCNYSCVTMSVSAVESRLLKLMCLASPESRQELEKKTLGQLISGYNDNKGVYKNVVPQRHKPLLDLCNTYRVFSVHPKDENISNMVATSIMNLSIEFLTDNDTKPKVVETQLINI